MQENKETLSEPNSSDDTCNPKIMTDVGYDLNIPKDVLFEILHSSLLVENIMDDLLKNLHKLFSNYCYNTIKDSVVEYLISKTPINFQGELGETFHKIIERNCKIEKKRVPSEQEQMANKLRQQVRSILVGNPVSPDFLNKLGCSSDQLHFHLELQFDDKMNWSNYGKWHVDHIRPLCSFDLTDESQVSIATHYSNLRPLWAIDNFKKIKSDKKLSIRKQISGIKYIKAN